MEGSELCELVALPLSNFELCDVGQKDLEDFEQWQSKQYNFSTLFSEKIYLSDWCAKIFVLGRLDGLLIWVNNSFWDKLLVSMRCFLGNFSDCFSEQCGKMFFWSLQPLVHIPCKILKFHLIFKDLLKLDQLILWWLDKLWWLRFLKDCHNLPV